MTLLHTLPRTSFAPVLFLPFHLRTLRDHSGFGNHATVADSDLRWRRARDQDGVYAKGTGRLVVANSAEQEAITDFTLFWWGPSTQPAGQVFAKRDAGGTHLTVSWDSSGKLALYDGSATALSLSALTLPFLRSVALSCVSGQAAIAYANGEEHSLMAAASTITGDDAPASIQNLYDGSAPDVNPLQGLLWYPGVLTASELSELHGWSQERQSPLVRSDRRYFDLGSRVPNQASGLVGAWDLGVITAGAVADKTDNEGHLSVTGNVAPVQSVHGAAASFDGASFLDGATLGALTECTILISMYHRTFADQIGFDLGVANDAIGVGFDSSGKPLVYDDIDNADDATLVGGVVPAGRVYRLALTITGATKELFLNGVSVVSGAGGGGGLADISSLDVRVGSRVGGLFFTDGLVGNAEVYNRVLADAEISEDAFSYANKVTLLDDPSQARPSFADEGGVVGHPLSNTEWLFGDTAGRWQVKEDANGGWRECTTAGLLYHSSPQAYGTWEFEFYKGAATTVGLHFLASSVDSFDGYGLVIDGNEKLSLIEFAGGTPTATHFATGDGYVTAGSWYRLRVTRRSDGEFTVYVKGGPEFPMWTQVVPTSGSNPVTDSTYTTSLVFRADLDVGDRAGDLISHHGVVPLV